ncbi:hypothetical protein SANTM175S_03374 [Streptomyces antimycoticus]
MRENDRADAVNSYSRLFRLDGRKAVVVGAGSGIGRESALALRRARRHCGVRRP